MTPTGFDTKWQAVDTEASFRKNCKTQPNDWKYRTQDVTYSVNSNGYRCAEFNSIDWSNSVVVLGCSLTFGIGVDDSETTSSLLQNILGHNVINLGMPGTGADYVLHNLARLKQANINPKKIIIQYPHSTRSFRWMTPNHVEAVSIGNDKKDFEQWFLKHDVHHKEHTKSCRDIIRLFYPDVFEYSSHSYVANMLSVTDWDTHVLAHEMGYTNMTDRARDLIHPGLAVNRAIAELLAKHIDL